MFIWPVAGLVLVHCWYRRPLGPGAARVPRRPERVWTVPLALSPLVVGLQLGGGPLPLPLDPPPPPGVHDLRLEAVQDYAHAGPVILHPPAPARQFHQSAAIPQFLGRPVGVHVEFLVIFLYLC